MAVINIIAMKSYSARDIITLAGGPFKLASTIHKKYYPNVPLKRLQNRALQWNFRNKFPPEESYRIAAIVGLKPEQVCPELVRPRDVA